MSQKLRKATALTSIFGSKLNCFVMRRYTVHLSQELKTISRFSVYPLLRNESESQTSEDGRSNGTRRGPVFRLVTPTQKDRYKE